MNLKEVATVLSFALECDIVENFSLVPETSFIRAPTRVFLAVSFGYVMCSRHVCPGIRYLPQMTHNSNCIMGLFIDFFIITILIINLNQT